MEQCATRQVIINPRRSTRGDVTQQREPPRNLKPSSVLARLGSGIGTIAPSKGSFTLQSCVHLTRLAAIIGCILTHQVVT
eukprot:2162987-Amphidinium_carterae.1